MALVGGGGVVWCHVWGAVLCVVGVVFGVWGGGVGVRCVGVVGLWWLWWLLCVVAGVPCGVLVCGRAPVMFELE